MSSAGPDPQSRNNRGRLSKEQRKEVAERLKAGETASAIAKDFGVTRQAISLIKAAVFHPERLAKRPRKLRSQPLPEEREHLIELLKSTGPADHGLHGIGDMPPELWTLERAAQLAFEKFGKRVFAGTLRECLEAAAPVRKWDPEAKPEPPKPADVRDLSLEMAADPDFVKYYLSPMAMQIRMREYELALKQYNERKGQEAQRAEEASADGYDDLPGATWSVPPPTGRRRGKHAGSKGSPFTKPKRKKKR